MNLQNILKIFIFLLEVAELKIDDFDKKFDIYQFHDLLFYIEKVNEINEELLAKFKDLSKSVSYSDSKFK
jgi:hypothetical protein